MSADRTMRLRRAAALALTIVLTACSWFTDFKDQPKFDPWTSPSDSIPMRGNPQNSVPIYGSAAPGYAVSRANLPATIDSMAAIPNPVSADARSLLNGRKYYSINCAVCHGDLGKGTWTFFGGHDPEDPQHQIGDVPTDLSLHPHSPGYRLILNNVLFPAAKKKELKT